MTRSTTVRRAGANSKHGHTIVEASIMTCDDFYEAQGRRDGAFEPWYTDSDKMAFLKK